MTPRRPWAESPLLLVAGFVLWASAFTLLYVVLSLGCEWGWDRASLGPVNLLRGILLAIWGAHILALIELFLYCRKHLDVPAGQRRFFTMAAIGATGTAIVSTIWIGLMLPVSSLCL